MLFKEIVDGRTHARTDGRTTDDGRRTLKDHKSSLEHFVLRWAKNWHNKNDNKIDLCLLNTVVDLLLYIINQVKYYIHLNLNVYV